jgi:hypothetical protein
MDTEKAHDKNIRQFFYRHFVTHLILKSMQLQWLQRHYVKTINSPLNYFLLIFNNFILSGKKITQRSIIMSTKKPLYFWEFISSKSKKQFFSKFEIMKGAYGSSN